MYVDDYVGGADIEEDTMDRCNLLKRRFLDGGMQKWSKDSPVIEEKIKANETSKEPINDKAVTKVVEDDRTFTDSQL